MSTPQKLWDNDAMIDAGDDQTSTGWIEVGLEVARGRRDRVWAAEFSSVSEWIEAVARRIGRSANVIRRWASVVDFIEMHAGRGEMPDRADLIGVPIACLELVARAHRIDRAMAVGLAASLISDHPPTYRDVRNSYQKLIAGRGRRNDADVIAVRDAAIRHIASALEPSLGKTGSLIVLDRRRNPFRYALSDFLMAVVHPSDDPQSDTKKWHGLHLLNDYFDEFAEIRTDKRIFGWIDLTASMLESLTIVVPAYHEIAGVICSGIRELNVSSCAVLGWDADMETFETLVPADDLRHHDRRYVMDDGFESEVANWNTEPTSAWGHLSDDPLGQRIWLDPGLIASRRRARS